MYVRAIRYRWLAGPADNGERLAAQLVESIQGRAGCRGVRVLSALDGGPEGLVLFEWETREGLEAHASATRLESIAPWAIPLLQWRTDQSYEARPPQHPPSAEPA